MRLCLSKSLEPSIFISLFLRILVLSTQMSLFLFLSSLLFLSPQNGLFLFLSSLLFLSLQTGLSLFLSTQNNRVRTAFLQA